VPCPVRQTGGASSAASPAAQDALLEGADGAVAPSVPTPAWRACRCGAGRGARALVFAGEKKVSREKAERLVKESHDDGRVATPTPPCAPACACCRPHADRRAPRREARLL
jgi:hypothetical protein